MSTLINHITSESNEGNQNTLREEYEMSAPTTRGPSNLNRALQGIKTTLEEIEMKLVSDMKNMKNKVSEGRRKYLRAVE